MTLRMAVRALVAQPVRSAVLVCGFGLGITAMAGLLGVGEVILEQSRAPALRGGGDVVIAGTTGSLSSPKFLLGNALARAPFDAAVAVASPALEETLYLVGGAGAPLTVSATGGIPSLERALGDPETSTVAGWTDAQADRTWTHPDPGALLRSMDRFHPIPQAPEFEESWAEWMYFNGTAGDVRFYLTFLAGPRTEAGLRRSGVRLQLEDDGRTSTWVGSADVDEATLLREAPNLTIGSSSVRLEGTRYRIALALRNERDERSHLTGVISLDASSGRSMPPVSIPGARGWVTGYVVPVLSGPIDGELTVDGRRIGLARGSGYHDHNWGFWAGVTWQWGQVAGDGLSLVWGRVRPPASAADPERMPAFVALLGPDGPLGYSTDASIVESEDEAAGRPSAVEVSAAGRRLRVDIRVSVESAVRNEGSGLIQMRGPALVRAEIDGRGVEFEAMASAETFR